MPAQPLFGGTQAASLAGHRCATLRGRTGSPNTIHRQFAGAAFRSLHILRVSTLKLLLVLLLTVAAKAQLAREQPVPPQSPAEAITGVWRGKTEHFEEFMTFTADGRMMLQRGPGETMTGTYKLDTATTPWKLDLTTRVKELNVTLYGLIEFPAPDQFRLSKLAPSEEERPAAEDLKNSKLVLNRIRLGPHGGIYQVVEAHLKRLDGTWEMKAARAPATLTLTKDGTYEIKTHELSDKGRFRIDVTRPPFALDLLSSEGRGPQFGIYEVSADGKLRLSNGSRSAEERPKDFTGPGTQELTRKPAAPR